MSEFNVMLRQLRRTYVGKQLSLAGTLGCTEAAISLWEHGERVPLRPAQAKIIESFRHAGAQSMELQALQDAYESLARKPRRTPT
jgi:DNA-binding transcriptional regulator YiaG